MDVRDIANCLQLRRMVNIHQADGQLKRASLRELTDAVLGKRIQLGAHSSVEDAVAALEVFKASATTSYILHPLPLPLPLAHSG